MTDFKAVIQRVTQNSTISGTGVSASAYTVQFSIGPHGPFLITVPADKFTTAEVLAETQKVADQINALPQGG